MYEENMPCHKCNDTGVFHAGPEEFRCPCPKGAVEVPAPTLAERLEKRVEKLEAENASLRERLWHLEQRVFR